MGRQFSGVSVNSGSRKLHPRALQPGREESLGRARRKLREACLCKGPEVCVSECGMLSLPRVDHGVRAECVCGESETN